MSDPREEIEANVLTTVEGVTIASGYTIPRDFRLITREIMDFPETVNRRPAVIIAFLESRSEPLELARTSDTYLPGVITVHFDPEPGLLPATQANAYKQAIRRALMQDPSRGSQNANTQITGVPTPALWIKTTPCIVDVTFEVQYIHEDAAA